MKLPKKRIKEVYIPNDPDKGVIIIRNLSMEEEAQIESKFLSIIANGEVSFTNYAERTKTFAIACLEGWRNLKDEDGKDLEFNSKNVELASAYSIITMKDGRQQRKRFFEWVDEERELFSKEVIDEENKAQGN